MRVLEKELSDERGEFNLFALLLREDAPSRWDLVISAPWTADDPKAPLKYVVGEIKSHVRGNELVNLSRVVLLKPSDKAVKRFNKAFSVRHGSIEVRDSELFGMSIRHGYIITSQRATSSPNEDASDGATKKNS